MAAAAALAQARIGRFAIERELGKGAQGAVYLAADTRLGRKVALKTLLASGDRAQLDGLLDEARIVSTLSHPNIVTLYDAGHGEHGPYLILELLHGETLAQRLERGPLPGTEALRIAVEVAKGLAHAHGQGVVHRDLTPGNVFLCIDGRVKVLDLGMAHAFGRRKVEGGTPAYMSPEQRRGAPEDERSDVFALGVLLYRMLSGELPSSCEEDAVVEGLGRAAPPGLGQLIGRLLAADPVDRPRDAGEVLERLAEYRTDADDRRGD